MAIPSALKPFTNPTASQPLDVNGVMTRGNDNLLGVKVNEVITELTAVESGTAPSGLSPFLLMGG